VRKRLGKLFKILDDVFSKYIRLRDCLHTTGTKQYGRCITCHKVYLIEDLHCGHFQDRDRKGTRYDERNCNGQCETCNSFNDGMIEVYEKEIDKKHGLGVAEELKEKARPFRRFFGYEIEEMIELYRKKIEVMG
jgi:Bacteriophage Lambda NinG protein